MSVIIVGGGMAGVTLALAISSLSQGKIPIALIEACGPDSQQQAGFDARTIALSQGSCQQLIRTGIWPSLSECATAIKRIQVNDSGYLGSMSLTAGDYAITALGYVIELHDAGQRLFTLLSKAAGVSLYCPARVVDVARSQSGATVTLDSGKQLQGQLMVAADGSSSLLANTCNIHWQQLDYQQIAVIANVVTARHPEGCAFERFTCDGPLALLPMSQGRSSLVWCHRQIAGQEVMAWDDERFLYQLQQAFGWRLGKMLKVGVRYSYPLRLLTASQHVSHRLALVGNAAQTLHPVAGQGFNLALRDVISLAEVLAKAAQTGVDLGAYQVLSQYQARRRTDQQTTVGITDGLIHLFSNHYHPLVVGRNLALMAMDNMPIIRDIFARRTLGWIER